MFWPATSLLCSSVWWAWSTPWLGPAVAARRARHGQRDDAGEIPLERQLDEPDHLIGDRRQLVAVVLVLTVAGRARPGRAGFVVAGRAGAERRQLGGRRALDLAPAVDQAVELLGVDRVHSQRPLGVGDVGEAEVEQALLAAPAPPAAGRCRCAGWLESLAQMR